MLVSIIVPVVNRPDLTEACLDSIVRYTDNYELILVQEGKDKEIKELLKRYDAKYFQNKKPKGFAGAMNTGISMASGDYYCFLNNDTVVVRGWLEEMLKGFEGNVGLVTPTFSAPRSYQHIDLNRDTRFDYVDDPFFIVGVCFLIKKEVMDDIGLWDETFGLGGGEDNDLCIRIKEAGYDMVVARKSYIHHYCGASFKEIYTIDEIKKKKEEQFKKLEQKHL